MKKLMLAVAAVAAMVVTASAGDLWRVKLASGTEMTYRTFAEAIAAADVADGSTVTLLGDDSTTFDGPVFITHAMTVTSAGETPFTLTRANEAGVINLTTNVAEQANFDVVFTNITIDGGTRWTNDGAFDITKADKDYDKDPNLAHTGLGAGRMFYGACAVYNKAPNLVLENGFTLQNVFGEKIEGNFNKGVIAAYLGSRGLNVEIREGAKITNCRSQSSIIVISDSMKFKMSGGEISHCYGNGFNDGGRFGLLYCNSETLLSISGGRIVNNAYASTGAASALIHYRCQCKNFSTTATGSITGGVITNNVCGGHFTIRLGDYSDNTVAIGGKPVIRGNYVYDCNYSNAPVECNIRSSVWNQSNKNVPVVMIGELEPGAYVGVTKNDDSDYFGRAISDAWEGYKYFHDDTQVTTAPQKGVLKVDGGLFMLGWGDAGKEEISYTCPGRLVRADGTAKGLEFSFAQPDASQVTIRYATSEEGPYGDEPITYAEVGVYDVWFELSAVGYFTTTNSARIVITPRASGGDAGTYRVKAAGATAWTECATLAEVAALVNAQGASQQGAEVELMRDDNVSWTSDVRFYRSFTLRSGEGGPYRLTRNNGETRITLGCTTADEGKATWTARFEDVVLDGFAVFSRDLDVLENDAYNLANLTGVRGVLLMCEKGGGWDTAVSLVLGSGCVIENVECGYQNSYGWCGGVVSSESGRTDMHFQDGFKLRNCRGECGVISACDGCYVYVDDAEVSGCYLSKTVTSSAGSYRGRTGLIYLNSKACTKLTGFKVINNVVCRTKSGQATALHVATCPQPTPATAIPTDKRTLFKDCVISNNQIWCENAWQPREGVVGYEDNGYICIEGDCHIIRNYYHTSKTANPVEANLYVRTKDSELCGGIPRRWVASGRLTGEVGMSVCLEAGTDTPRAREGGVFARAMAGVRSSDVKGFVNDYDAALIGRLDKTTMPYGVYWGKAPGFLLLVR